MDIPPALLHSDDHRVPSRQMLERFDGHLRPWDDVIDDQRQARPVRDRTVITRKQCGRDRNVEMRRRHLQGRRAGAERRLSEPYRFVGRISDDAAEDRNAPVHGFDDNRRCLAQFLGGHTRAFARAAANYNPVHSRFKQKLRLGAEQGAVDRIIVGERRNHGRNDAAELPDFVRVGIHRERPGPQRFPPYHRGHWLSRSSECIPKRNRALRSPDRLVSPPHTKNYWRSPNIRHSGRWFTP